MTEPTPAAEPLDPTAPIPADAAPRRSRWTVWLLVLPLIAPAAIPFVVHWFPRQDGRVPTGYIQRDFPIYYGKGREHFDPGQFHWTYSQPASDRYDEPRVYVQPWTLALGLAHRYAGLPPGVVYDGFWLVSALFCAAAALALYRGLVGLETWPKRLGLLLFFWGGGLLTLCGTLAELAARRRPDFWTIFRFDPVNGWWFLNFGRNLLYPTEALYHGLVFLTILFTSQRRFVLATAFAFLTCFNSPFAGAGLLAVLWSWCLLELVFLENRARITGFFVAINALLVAFLAYYIVFLNRFPEHKIVARQMEFHVNYPAVSFVPALILVGLMAAWTLRTIRTAGVRLGAERNRLLLVWFLVTFALSHHDFAIRPRQPIHFDRGYAYVALFLLGAPALFALFEGLTRRLPRRLAQLAIAGVVLVFLSDNLAWFAAFPYRAYRGLESESIRIKPDEAAVLKTLDDRGYYGDLVLSEDEELGNLVISETPLRSWVAHVYETPNYEARVKDLDDLFRAGRFNPAWDGRPLIVVARRKPDAPDVPPAWVAERGGKAILTNPSYGVYRIVPRAGDETRPRP